MSGRVESVFSRQMSITCIFVVLTVLHRAAGKGQFSDVLAEDNMFVFTGRGAERQVSCQDDFSCPPKQRCFEVRKRCVAVQCTLNSHCDDDSFCLDNVCHVRRTGMDTDGVLPRRSIHAESCNGNDECAGGECVMGKCRTDVPELTNCTESKLKCHLDEKCHEGLCYKSCKGGEAKRACRGFYSKCNSRLGICLREDQVGGKDDERALCESSIDCRARYEFCLLGVCTHRPCIFTKSCRRHNPASGFKCRRTKSLGGKQVCQKRKICPRRTRCEAGESCHKRQCWKKCKSVYDCMFDGYAATEYQCYQGKCIHVSYIPDGYCDPNIKCPGTRTRCDDFTCTEKRKNEASEESSAEDEEDPSDLAVGSDTIETFDDSLPTT